MGTSNTSPSFWRVLTRGSDTILWAKECSRKPASASPNGGENWGNEPARTSPEQQLFIATRYQDPGAQHNASTSFKQNLDIANLSSEIRAFWKAYRPIIPTEHFALRDAEADGSTHHCLGQFESGDEVGWICGSP